MVYFDSSPSKFNQTRFNKLISSPTSVLHKSPLNLNHCPASSRSISSYGEHSMKSMEDQINHGMQIEGDQPPKPKRIRFYCSGTKKGLDSSNNLSLIQSSGSSNLVGLVVIVYDQKRVRRKGATSFLQHIMGLSNL